MYINHVNQVAAGALWSTKFRALANGQLALRFNAAATCSLSAAQFRQLNFLLRFHISQETKLFLLFASSIILLHTEEQGSWCFNGS
ncbi:unnamed protein product [Coffea canephora]|uniref:Uncharacterized protein n=1 Tax=Coffea canephora TaxID=49390 RepID=A0A068TYW0_COFCA|nr:unnamed protein product [Coffea canephora]